LLLLLQLLLQLLVLCCSRLLWFNIFPEQAV
jgi:hypothetical protein